MFELKNLDPDKIKEVGKTLSELFKQEYPEWSEHAHFDTPFYITNFFHRELHGRREELIDELDKLKNWISLLYDFEHIITDALDDSGKELPERNLEDWK